ncbi:PQQ-binding-like beta-propeller repeat protein [Rhodovulum sp. DZ06]|uniref:outer membrane protein assembly factor BamB family protein n=1 Tax=Rhodovulum sp. DZ06 TaxID=3425126 RepID=UPI003D35258D
MSLAPTRRPASRPASLRMTARSGARLSAAALALLALGACSSNETPRLPGERIAIRAAELGANEEGLIASRPLPPVAESGSWTHAGGDAAHGGGRRQGLAGAPALAWSASVGDAPGEKTLPTGLVAADGRIFARDGAAGVRAFDAASGSVLWTADLALEGEESDDAYGGGLAIGPRGRVYATTGHGEVVALDPSSGEIAWRARGTAPYRGAPVVTGGEVAAVDTANMVRGFSIADGSPAWTVEGLSTRRGNLGRGAPAGVPGAVLAPFGSGELAVIRTPSGVRVWSINLSAGAAGEGLSAFTDVTSGPVVMGGVILAGVAGGPFKGIDGRRGTEIWSRGFGSLSPAWAALDTAYVVTTEPRILRIDARTGATLWSRALEGFEDMEDREDPVAWAGPVLAGDTVWTVSSDGRLAGFDAVSGQPGPVVEMPGGASAGPIAVDGRLHVLTDDGRLLTYR